MGAATQRPCTYPGCGRLVRGASRCDKHAYAQQRDHKQENARRDHSHKHLYNWQWRMAAKQFLREHPLCCVCEAAGRVTAASEVDHRRPHHGARDLFWDGTNWQPLCKPCHSRKTATEDGGFGHTKT